MHSFHAVVVNDEDIILHCLHFNTQETTPNLKLSPDEESDIAGLLSSTPQPIPDFDELGVAGGNHEDVVLPSMPSMDIGQPLSPMEPSPPPPPVQPSSESEDEEKQRQNVKPKSKKTESKEGRAKPKPQFRPVARRQTNQAQVRRVSPDLQ